MPANVLYSIICKKENAHADPIYCCDWVKTDTSGDSKNAAKDVIVTGGLDGLVKVWILQNDRLEVLHILEGHTMGVVSVGLSPTSSSIVSVSLDSHLIIWNLSTGKKVTEVPIGESDVWKVAFCPEGDQIATGGHSGKIYLYGVNDGVAKSMLDTRGKFIMSIDWSPNGKYIATGSEDGVICILDVYQGKLLHTIEAHAQAIRAITFTPCSKGVASASKDGFLKIYGVIGAGLHCTLEHKAWVVSVCFTPDGTRVATGDADGRVRVADAHDLTLLNTFEEHSDTVWGVRFDSNSKRLISVSKDGCINLYECPPPVKK